MLLVIFIIPLFNFILNLEFITSLRNHSEGIFKAFNWDCVEVSDGHSFEELLPVFKESNAKGKPRVIIVHTTKGKGIKTFENDPAWHARKVKGEELEIGKKELGLV